jgi:hypothetical protein
MITWDDKNFIVLLEKVGGGVDGVAMQAAHDMADTLLILSRAEVPHDEGMLQISGHTEQEKDGWLTVYNSVYAAFQHEGRRKDGSHVIRHYQKGRKGKYLEDPLMRNTAQWNNIAAKKMAAFLAKGGL